MLSTKRVRNVGCPSKGREIHTLFFFYSSIRSTAKLPLLTNNRASLRPATHNVGKAKDASVYRGAYDDWLTFLISWPIGSDVGSTKKTVGPMTPVVEFFCRCTTLPLSGLLSFVTNAKTPPSNFAGTVQLLSGRTVAWALPPTSSWQ
jgi:hypothetical protein